MERFHHNAYISNSVVEFVQMILSFELPFALIPLLKFSSSKTKMGPHKNSIYVGFYIISLFLQHETNTIILNSIIIKAGIEKCIGRTSIIQNVSQG